MKQIILPASLDQLDVINDFINEELESCGCSMKVQMQVNLAVEEIFVNIASYAYCPEVGEAEISVEVGGEPPMVTITFLDHGHPFDPLAREDADTSLSAEERGVGGLGILLVKKTMDSVEYSYENGKNILTIKKTL